MIFSKNSIILLFITLLPMNFNTHCEMSLQARDKGFVYLHEVDPTIQVSLRYYGTENFVGKTVTGYKRPVVMMTRQAAEALKRAQAAFKKDGYCLVVYDAYRPQQAVDNFISWSIDIKDQIKKNHYYPRIDKARIFELGYVAKRSGHTRGSTVDLTIIKDGQLVHAIVATERKLLDGFTITFLDDGTVDMGSSFDFADVASHFENDVIAQEYKNMRAYLQKIMIENGFKPYAEEWWHFTLKDEPYPANHDSSYFDFEIE